MGFIIFCGLLTLISLGFIRFLGVCLVLWGALVGLVFCVVLDYIADFVVFYYLTGCLAEGNFPAGLMV